MRKLSRLGVPEPPYNNLHFNSQFESGNLRRVVQVCYAILSDWPVATVHISTLDTPIVFRYGSLSMTWFSVLMLTLTITTSGFTLRSATWWLINLTGST